VDELKDSSENDSERQSGESSESGIGKDSLALEENREEDSGG
jgi:hypothetical protein